MRRHFLTCVALLASVCALLARDITTLTGQTYRNVTVTRVDQRGIAITHRDGTAFLDFFDLTPELRAEVAQIETDPDSVQPTPELVHSPAITTLDGNVYRDVTVTRIERTGIRVSHRDGIGFIDYVSLPAPLRRRYGYTEAAYAAGMAVRLQGDLTSAATQRRMATETAAQEAEAQRQRAEAQAAVARQQASIATRDYSATNHIARDYGADRFTGSGYTGGTVQVSGYFRKDGTYVHSYTRRK